MTSAAIHPKGPRRGTLGTGALHWVDSRLGSTVGRKVLVAITGLALSAFVVFHMIGNLKMFSGPESVNRYAHFLKHDLGVLLWVARGGLLLLFVLHLYLAIRLKLRAVAARPIAYEMQRTAQATIASRTMIWTGLVILAFVAFHLAHYTLAWVHDIPDADGRGTTNYLDMKYRLPNGEQIHDVYAMMIAGFTTSWIAAIYLVAQILLFIHLSHGIQSALSTLGLVGKEFANAAKWLGYFIAATILIGNVAIVIAVWTGYVK